jgi:hypothetical protein
MILFHEELWYTQKRIKHTLCNQSKPISQLAIRLMLLNLLNITWILIGRSITLNHVPKFILYGWCREDGWSGNINFFPDLTLSLFFKRKTTEITMAVERLWFTVSVVSLHLDCYVPWTRRDCQCSLRKITSCIHWIF